MNEITFKGPFLIRTYEIDNKKNVTIPSLMKLMHEAAMQNVLNLKLSVWDLEPHKISWVLMRKKISIDRLPRLGETIHIETHPAGFEKFFTYRDYKVFDENDQLIAFASSTWLLMDTEKRRMTRIPDFILDYQNKMKPAEACLPRPDDKLPKFETAGLQKQYTVNWHDLDFNMHLNNTFYAQWMLEALPDNCLVNGTIKQLDIMYRMEAKWKERIVSEVQQLEENTYLHRLKRLEDGKELALGRSTW